MLQIAGSLVCGEGCWDSVAGSWWGKWDVGATADSAVVVVGEMQHRSRLGDHEYNPSARSSERYFAEVVSAPDPLKGSTANGGSCHRCLGQDDDPNWP